MPQNNVYISNIESLILLAWTWKKTKRICTATQEETCLSGECFTENEKKRFWGKPEGKRIEWTRKGFTHRDDVKESRARPLKTGDRKSHFIIPPLPAFFCSHNRICAVDSASLPNRDGTLRQFCRGSTPEEIRWWKHKKGTGSRVGEEKQNVSAKRLCKQGEGEVKPFPEF